MSWPDIDLSGALPTGIDRGLTTIASTATHLWTTSPALTIAVGVALLVGVSMARPNRV